MGKSIIEAPAEWFFYRPRNAGDLVVLVPLNYIPVDMRGDQDQMSEHLGMPLADFEVLRDIQDVPHRRANVTAAHITSCISPGSGPWNFLLFGHGWMGDNGVTAQLPLAEFQGLLNFCDEQINTNAFFYKTCHSGGSNGIKFFVNPNTNTPLVLNYPVVCLVSNNMPTMFSFAEYNPEIDQMPRRLNNAQRLERVLRFFRQRTQTLLNLPAFYQALHLFERSDDVADLALAAQACVPDLTTGAVYKKITHLPRLRAAGSECFTCLHVPGRDADAIVYFEPTPKGAATPALDLVNKRALIVSRHEVKNILTINTEDAQEPSPAIISIMPREAFHVFDNIRTNRPVQDFLNDSFCSHPIRTTHFWREVPFTQITYIKQLTTGAGTTQEAHYSNVLICAEESTQAVTVFVPLQDQAALVGTQVNDVEGVAWNNIKGNDVANLKQQLAHYSLNAFLRFSRFVNQTPFSPLGGYLDQPFATKAAYLEFLQNVLSNVEALPLGMIAWMKRNPVKASLLGATGIGVAWLGIDYAAKGRKRSIVGRTWDKWVKKTSNPTLPGMVSVAA